MYVWVMATSMETVPLVTPETLAAFTEIGVHRLIVSIAGARTIDEVDGFLTEQAAVVLG